MMSNGTTAPPELIDNFSRYVVNDSGCWIWDGPIYPDSGYGKTSVVLHGTRTAHVAFFLEHVGEFNRSLDLDHICRVRSCVNPYHLEPVTREENLRRGREARFTGMCQRGKHRMDAPGQCTECWRERYRAAGARYRARQRDHADTSRSSGH
jgi:hypothetical protein